MRSTHTFCQLDARIDRETYEKLIGNEIVKKKDVLMLFCDRSWSMNGAPFKAMTEGMAHIADTIYGRTAEEDNFSDVHVVYYDNELYDKVTRTKEEYLEKIYAEEADGGTDFIICFEYMHK